MKHLRLLSFIFLFPFLVFSQKTAPQLGKNSVKEVIAAMTLEEKAHLVVGMGMRFGPPQARRDSSKTTAPQQQPVIGQTQQKVPGAAGTTFAIPRLGIPSIVVADGPAGLRIQPIRNND